MTHREEVHALRRKASEFLAQAKSALRDGHHNLACFLSDQAVQLYLKSVLLELVGDYPRTHSIRLLIRELMKVKPSKDLEEFLNKNRARISSLEDAYIMARYTAKEYEEEDARDSLMLAEELIRLVGGGA